MKIKQIISTEPNVAKLLDREPSELSDNEVLVKTAYSTISAGTERANLVGDLNIDPTMMLPRLKEERLGELFSFGREVTVFAASKECRAAIGAYAYLLPQLDFSEAESGILSLSLDPSLSSQAEYYEIESGEGFVRIRAVDYAGLVHAAATLSLLLACGEEGYLLPTARICDYPDTTYRAYMLDPARGLIPMEQLRAVIIGMARAKMNKLHLHLSDHRGFSYRSRVFPDLPVIPSGAYTLEELKETIALCSLLGIDVIPEIDLPAHASAIVEWRPQLRCQSDEEADFSPWNLCLGNEDSYALIEKLLGELAEIFPYECIHVGTDEIHMGDIPTHKDRPISHCLECTVCNSFFAPMGYGTLCERFYYFVRRVHAMLKKLGKRMMMWNDNVDISHDPDIPHDILIEFWRVAAEKRGPVEGCSMQGFVDAGFDVVNTDFPNTYLEEYVSFEKLITWNPLAEPAVDVGGRIKGMEVCLWGGSDVPQFAYVAFVALPLYGDRAWNCSAPIPNDKNTALSLTRALLGVGTPTDFDLLSYFSEVPLSNACLLEEGILAENADLGKLRSALTAISPAAEDQAFFAAALLALIRRKETGTLWVGKSF